MSTRPSNPEGPTGEQILLAARNPSVADVCNALTTKRSYRGAFTATEARGLLRQETGRALDPPLVPAFEDVPSAWS